MKRKLYVALALLALTIPFIVLAVACEGDPVDEFASEDIWVNTIHELDGPDINIDEDITIDGTTTLDGNLYTDRWLNSDTNTIIGVDALGNNGLSHTAGDEGYYNSYIGYNSGYDNTTGYINTATGALALENNTTGRENVAFGTSALRDNTTGIKNNAIGYAALTDNEDGNYNTANGQGALQRNVSGNSNTAMGYGSLTYNTASSNTAYGYQSARSLSSGGSNVIIGYNASYYNQTGDRNVIVGREAGLGASTKSYDNNTLAGYRAGYNLETGSGNVMVGQKAGYNETGSNTLYIDNSDTNALNALIYGEFDNDLLRINGTLQVSDDYIELDEMTAPGAGAADTVRIYAVVDGGGLTDLNAVFQDGTVDTFAQETTPLDSPIFTESSGTELTYKMVKPHPGLIQFVVEYPSGERFVMREIEYHDAEKIAANVGCDSTKLPDGWVISTLQERVDDQLLKLNEKIIELELALDNAHDRKITKEAELIAAKDDNDKEFIQDEIDGLTSHITGLEQYIVELEEQKVIEQSRLTNDIRG